jgi:hypothetical protein
MRCIQYSVYIHIRVCCVYSTLYISIYAYAVYTVLCIYPYARRCARKLRDILVYICVYTAYAYTQHTGYVYTQHTCRCWDSNTIYRMYIRYTEHMDIYRVLYTQHMRIHSHTTPARRCVCLSHMLALSRSLICVYTVTPHLRAERPQARPCSVH